MINKYFQLSGRMCRKQYFAFGASLLGLFILSQVFILGSFALDVFGSPIMTIPDIPAGTLLLEVMIVLTVFFFYLTSSVQRLHDTGRSGLWFLLVFMPLGEWILLILTLQKGDDKDNQWGSPIL